MPYFFFIVAATAAAKKTQKPTFKMYMRRRNTQRDRRTQTSHAKRNKNKNTPVSVKDADLFFSLPLLDFSDYWRCWLKNVLKYPKENNDLCVLVCVFVTQRGYLASVVFHSTGTFIKHWKIFPLWFYCLNSFVVSVGQYL